ncbi:MAG: UDP-N-acetylenolpyruvoylglucosamine reductase [Candidatus Magasanikbacteria bacterium GW2011_GWA2_37_8]|uniref:UDP-N-acetylenolpyruvoylglucosamine reductase n=1 Tax=Candidatus Magasanikbacteria bacterium GW2011_GWA2_37_8 TaxID=1619036 RepID=A0A0G0HLN1_9BACT|nr:MAG: UDP-N-acetylenolpyruvoylglucosamine reductase [Candidatus Magasanikbacteria bacterium GW2011_GWA2_37_8]
MNDLYQQLKNFGHVKNNVALSKYSTFKVGGPAQFLVEVTENYQIIKLLNYLNEYGAEYYILGSGSNILFPDEGLEKVVIKMQNGNLKMENENEIIAEAGVQLGAVVNLAAKEGLSGMEWAVGIPGTIGGAVRGNAGAMGKETSNVVSTIKIWRNGEILDIPKEECSFGYRESMFKNSTDVILSATFILTPADKKDIMASMQKYLGQRTGRYPHFPSAGSFFKNIDIKNWPGDINKLPEIFRERGKIPVGWLVEQVEMKGYTVGGAKVSDEHGNFIVNFNNATKADVLTVVEAVQTKVYNKFRIALESEVEIVR